MYNLHIYIYMAYKFDPALHVALVAMKIFMHMDTIVF